jgi:YD repeat-containing protein
MRLTYTSGVNTYDANYAYDGNARLTKLTDWIDAVDGLEYAYDATGRLTQLTDYDGTTLDYAVRSKNSADDEAQQWR